LRCRLDLEKSDTGFSKRAKTEYVSTHRTGFSHLFTEPAREPAKRIRRCVHAWCKAIKTNSLL
jgi:hypothetical protein